MSLLHISTTPAAEVYSGLAESFDKAFFGPLVDIPLQSLSLDPNIL